MNSENGVMIIKVMCRNEKTIDISIYGRKIQVKLFLNQKHWTNLLLNNNTKVWYAYTV